MFQFTMEYDVFLLRMGVALLLGALVGIERQIKQRSAGLVTNALVSVGAALYVLISVSLGTGDVLRVLGQIVTGIGFLGAGVIMRDGFTVHGLNTAATLWCSAAIGSAAGFGLLMEASVGTIIIILTHSLFKPIVDFINKQPNTSKLTIRNIGYIVKMVCSAENEAQLRSIAVDYLNSYEGLQLRLMKSTYDEQTKSVEIQMEILYYEPNKALIEEFVGQISKISFVTQIQLDSLRETIKKSADTKL